MNLSEGLKEGDLRELVHNILSIDEYESKLDDDSIVIAFAVQDREPAEDLNRFIQKGAVEILDTDVSPAPNEDGDYLVFVELLRDAEFPKKALDMLGSINSLTGLDEWKAVIYDVEDTVDVTLENLERLVRLESIEDHEGHVHEDQEELVEFFRASDLEDLRIQEHEVTMEARGVKVSLRLVDLGEAQDVMANNAVMDQATRLDEVAQSNTRRVQRLLGEQWLVEQRGDYLVVANISGPEVALFGL